MSSDRSQPPPAPPSIWLLVLITLSGTVGMHMFVPALASASQDLGAPSGQLQWTITIYVAGLAIGQLVYGPLSDALGRVPVLRTGLILYVAGGIACALAPSVPALLVARFAQSMGAGAGLVLGRTITRDTSSRESAVSRLALLSVLLIFGPGLAPMLGGLATSWAGWRGVFVVLAGVGLLTLALSWVMLPETLPRREPLRVRRLAAEFAQLARTPAFTGLAVASGGTIFSVYAFLGAAPFIFTQLNEPVGRIGVYTGIIVFGAGFGALVAMRLGRRYPPRRLLLLAHALHTLCVMPMLACALLGQLTVLNVVVCMTLYMVGNGIATPVSMSMAMDASPRLTGSAAGLLGAIHFTIGATCTAAASLGHDPGVSAFTVMGVAAAISTILYGVGAIRTRKAG